MAESEEELNSLLMNMKKESEKVGLKLNLQKMKIIASGPITSWQIYGETMETMRDFTFTSLKHTYTGTALIKLKNEITADGDCSHEIKRRLLLGRKVDQPR